MMVPLFTIIAVVHTVFCGWAVAIVPILISAFTLPSSDTPLQSIMNNLENSNQRTIFPVLKTRRGSQLLTG